MAPDFQGCKFHGLDARKQLSASLGLDAQHIAQVGHHGAIVEPAAPTCSAFAPLGLQALPDAESLDVARPQVAKFARCTVAVVIVAVDKPKGRQGFIKFGIWCMA